jgi:hypothetical protein
MGTTFKVFVPDFRLRAAWRGTLKSSTSVPLPPRRSPRLAAALLLAQPVHFNITRSA